MIGDHVEQHTQAAFSSCCAELTETFQPAKVRIQFAETTDVIAVGAFRAGAEKGRSVTVADSQLLQVIENFPRLGEGKITVELQPIRRDRYALGIHLTRLPRRVPVRAAPRALRPDAARNAIARQDFGTVRAIAARDHRRAAPVPEIPGLRTAGFSRKCAARATSSCPAGASARPRRRRPLCR